MAWLPIGLIVLCAVLGSAVLVVLVVSDIRRARRTREVLAILSREAMPTLYVWEVLQDAGVWMSLGSLYLILNALEGHGRVSSERWPGGADRGYRPIKAWRLKGGE